MKLLFLLFCNFLLFFSATAQKITVLDAASKKPIANVNVSNYDKTVVQHTNSKGIADLTAFTKDELIYFTHKNYQLFIEKKKNLLKSSIFVHLTKSYEKLDEIILQVFKNESTSNRIAEQIAVLNTTKIDGLGAQNSADILNSILGIKVQKSQFGGGSPVLRGMEANRILLVVDGVRMNNAIYRKGHLQNAITVAPSIIEKTEVVFGPSSVIYGSDALGGVIHYYTKTPKFSENNEIHGNFLTRYSSVNNEITNSLTTNLKFKNWASITSVSHSDFGNLKMGTNRTHGFNNWGITTQFITDNEDLITGKLNSNNTTRNTQPNTNYQQTDFLQKLHFKTGATSNLSFNFQYSTAPNIKRFDKLSEYKNGNLKFAQWYYGDQKRLLFSPQFSFSPNKSWMKKGNIILGYQNIKESRIQRKFKSFKRSYRTENVDVYSLNADFSLITAQNRDLSYGIEATYNNVKSNAFGKIINPKNNTESTETFKVQSRYPDGGSSYTSSAFYVNYRQDISYVSTLNTGLRLTNTILKAKWLDESFIKLPLNNIQLANTAITATIGYVYKIKKNWQFNTVLSSGFRSPNIDDVGKVREKNGKITVPNINLKPEYAYNAEIGIQKYFNTNKFRISSIFYYTLLDNYIYRDNFTLNGKNQITFNGEQGTTVANVNKGNAYIYGGTLGFEGKLLSKWNSSGSVTFTKGKSFDLKAPLSSIPPIFGDIQLQYASKKLEFNGTFKFNAQKNSTDYNILEGIDNIEQTPIVNNDATNLAEKHFGTPSWWTISCGAKLKINSKLAIQAHVNNILDTHYKEFASGISAPGRNISISLNAKF